MKLRGEIENIEDLANDWLEGQRKGILGVDMYFMGLEKGCMESYGFDIIDDLDLHNFIL